MAAGFALANGPMNRPRYAALQPISTARPTHRCAPMTCWLDPRNRPTPVEYLILRYLQRAFRVSPVRCPIQETVSASTEVIAQKLARVITLTELYRKQDKNYECNIRIAYSAELARKAAQDVIKEELETKTNVTREKLDKLMNF